MRLIKPSQTKRLKRAIIKLPELMAKNSFVSLFIFLLVALAIGAGVFYRYSKPVFSEGSVSPEVLDFKEGFYNAMLGVWEGRTDNMIAIDSKSYINPFMAIDREWDPVSFLEAGNKELISELSGEKLESVLAILNLYEYYTSKGEKLPSVDERALIWESFGLGKKEEYIGTRYQNQILLNKLKEVD